MTKAACINTFIPESKLCQPSDVKPCDSAIISTPGSDMAARKTPDVTNIACVYFLRTSTTEAEIGLWRCRRVWLYSTGTTDYFPV